MTSYKYKVPTKIILFILSNILAILFYSEATVYVYNVKISNIVILVIAIILQLVMLYLSSNSFMISISYVVFSLYIATPLSLYFITGLLLPLLIALFLNKELFRKDSLLITIYNLSRKTYSERSISLILHSLARYFACLTIMLTVMYFFLELVAIPSTIRSIYIVFLPISIATGFILITLWEIEPLIASMIAAFSIYSLGVFPGVIIGYNAAFTEKEKIVEGIYFGDVVATLEYGYPSKQYFDAFPHDSKMRKTWYWRKSNERLIIDIDDLPNQHLVIVGASGMGKSFLAKHIVRQMIKKYNYKAIIIDFHNEYNDLIDLKDILYIDAKNVSINPFTLTRLSPREQAHYISQLISSIFNLGNIQQITLENIIIKSYEHKGIYEDKPETWHNKPPTSRDIINTALALSDEFDTKRVLPYLKTLDSILTQTTELNIEKIVQHSAIINLSELPSEFMRIIYVYTLLQNILDYLYTKRVNKRIVIVIDEAHRIFSRKFARTIISRYLMESRKYGISIIIITQQPTDLISHIFQNTVVKASFRINEPKNLEYMAKIICEVEDQAKVKTIKYALRNVDRGEYVIKIETMNKIYLVRIK